MTDIEIYAAVEKIISPNVVEQIPVFKPLIEEEEVTITIGPNMTAIIEAFNAMKPGFEQLAQTLGETYKELADAFGPFLEQINLIANKIAPPLVPIDPNSNHEAKHVLAHPLMKMYKDCPVRNCPVHDRLKHLIMHLNDEHKYSREEIANWLDTLDEQPIFYPQIESDGKTLTGN